MVRSMNDYHIHLCLDSCAKPEMTFENIEKVVLNVGLKEICILKHYSLYLPNARDSWIFWKRIKKEAFDSFIEQIAIRKKSFKLKLLSGVETELVDCKGTINIPQEDVEKLDVVVLSVHWLPRLEVITAHSQLDPYHPHKTDQALLAEWDEEVSKVGSELILENFVKTYVKAIEANAKLLVLGHMYDGMLPLRQYRIPVDDISVKKLCEIFTPLFKICSEKGVLWELSAAESLSYPDFFAYASKVLCHF